MSEFDAYHRPKTPPKVAWFEFLLNPSLLEEHLEKDDCNPTASELIALFLYQADLANATAKEIAKNSEEAIIIDGERVDSPISDNKKAKALKALAFSVAAILKWNLNTLEKGLPLATVESILLELLAATLPGVEPIAKRHAALDLKAITPEAVFSVLLYHRWTLRTGVKDKFPTKASKVPNVQVPGLLDPSVMSANKKDSILNNVRDNLDDSCTVLEHYAETKPAVVLPTVKCFHPTEPTDTQTPHDWSLALHLPQEEVLCQVGYELGTMYFHRQDYDKACQMFLDVRKHLDELGDEHLFADIDTPSLDGYLCACGAVLGRHVPGDHSEQAKLIDAIESIRQDNFLGLTSTLMQDNFKQVLSLSYRQSLEEDVKATNTSETFIQEVVTCNRIRQAMEGHIAPAQYRHMLTHKPEYIEFLLDMVTGVLEVMKESQKSNMKHFIRYLCHGLPKSIGFPTKLADSDVKILFSEDELCEMKSTLEETKEPLTLGHNAYPESDERTNIAELQQELLITYDPPVIKSLVHKLLRLTGRANTCYLSEKWRLPKEFHMTIDAIPVSQPEFTTYMYVMISKAKVALQLKMYTEARLLLHTSEQAVKSIAYKLSKLLRWELLKLDLLIHDQTNTLPAGVTLSELLKRCKGCISTIHQEQDLLPGSNMSSVGVIVYLLNQREWDFLSGLPQKNAPGYVELGRLIGILCKELPQQKNARKHARDLWEAVTLIFTTSTQQKRGGGGTSTNITRESNLGLVPHQLFNSLCGRLVEPQILSVMISLVTKLYNILKDDLTVEIASDFLTLWPSILGNTSSISVAMVTETVKTLMEKALETHPTQPSWIRTYADIQYAQCQYSQAIKWYLQLGVVVTDYFVKPITRNVFDENILRRMIRCCTYLNCHTQIVVLCQFLDEVDYTTAFKAIQERNIHDAMDTYYEYIWDVTILEYLIYYHNKRGEFDKKQHLLSLIGQMELNSSNPAEILFEAAKVRKANFLRALVKEYI